MSMEDESDPKLRLEAFLTGLEAGRRRLFKPRKEEGLRGLAKLVVPQGARVPIRVAGTRAVIGWQRRKAQALAAASPLRLHLGCHTNRLPGWVNVDLLGVPVDLAWDLTRPFPFTDRTVDAIFHEHVIEHLRLRDGYHLARECHRMLKRGGVLRIAVPDAGSAARRYVQAPETMTDGAPTPMLALQQGFYFPGHLTGYDLDTLSLVLRAAGFREPEEREFGDSRILPCPDSRDPTGTLIVEVER